MRTVLVLGVGLALFGACSSDSGGQLPDDPSLCALAGAPAGCGQPCATDGTGGCGPELHCGTSGLCVPNVAPTGGDGGFPTDGGNPFNQDGACAVANSSASLVKPPVDIIVVIDNSGSMTNEIVAVENNINTNLASIIGASGLDYRVILVSRHGSATGSQSICVSMPLSGNATCMPPPTKPTNTANFFHYSVEIGSHNAFDQIIATYNKEDEHKLAPLGWSDWLRADSAKTFIVITDDEATGLDSAQFDTALLALTPQRFGDATKRNYTFHSIVGLKENAPATAAWQPTDPIQNGKCTANGGDVVNAGIEYQEVSVLTGGLRFPLCEYTSFDVVFQTVAQGVVAGTQVACDFAIPAPPPGETLDLTKIAVQYTPGGGGAPQYFKQAVNAAACVPDAFYVENGRIFLCPATCTAVQADAQAKVDVLFTCDSTLIL